MNKKIKVSLTLNILIVLMTIAACIIMFTGFKFMHAYPTILQSTKIGMLRFFTVQSNLFAGIVSLIFAIKEIQIIRGKRREISKRMYILKLMSSTAVGLTFFVVFAYLGPLIPYGVPALLMNANLFFHLIIPLVSIINFVCFERTDKLRFRNSFWGILPTALYGVYYLTNVCIHMEDGKVSPVYDWYYFVQKGVWTAAIVVPIMLLITYIISLIIWRLNRPRKQLKGKDSDV
jgi:hypothetical protein